MELKISSPCPKSWDDLVGDQRIRYCGQCKLNVYNFAEMDREEVERIVRKSEGRLCGTLYVRGDRTATLRDCPSARARTLVRRAVKVASFLLLAGFTGVCRTSERPDRSNLPRWIQQTLSVIDPERPPAVPRPPHRLMGDVVCAPAKPPAPPPTAVAP
jgi:hypothetical protein